MKKAFTLVELIVVISVLPVVTIALSKIFATFIRDIPRMTRAVERSTPILDMVQQMRDDLDRAVVLPDAGEGRRTDEQTLLIGLPNAVICYELQAGQMVRSVLSGADEIEETPPRKWTFPEAEVVWSRRQENNIAYAVEIHTHVSEKVGSQVKAKLANSYLLFLNGLGEGGQPL